MISNIVKYSQLKNETSLLRFDSEFYSKELMDYDLRIIQFGYRKLGDLIDILTDYTANGSFASLAKNVNVMDEKNYAKWIRIQNLDNNNFNDDIRYVDRNSYDFLKKSSLFGNELLISKTGEYLGKCYIFKPNDSMKYTLADNIFLLKLKNKKLDNFIYTFINSSIGRKLLLRYSQGTGQPTIIKDNLRELKIPDVSEKYLNLINKIINKRFNLLNDSNRNYEIAKLKIDKDIFPDKFVFSKSNNTVKRFSEIFDNNMRIDSEYYQLKYSELDKLLDNKYKLLSELVCIEKSVDPGSDCYVESNDKNAIPFLRISNLTSKKINDNYLYVDKSKIKNINDLYLKKNDILLSKDGTIGIAYLLNKDLNAIVCGGILRLKIKDENLIDKNYLTLVLNSSIVKLQAERDCGGSILEHWKKEQIDNIKIPIVSYEVQNEVSKLIKTSFEELEESERLLDIAKKSIEILINQSEAKAVDYLNINIYE